VFDLGDKNVTALLMLVISFYHSLNCVGLCSGRYAKLLFLQTRTQSWHAMRMAGSLDGMQVSKLVAQLGVRLATVALAPMPCAKLRYFCHSL